MRPQCKLCSSGDIDIVYTPSKNQDKSRPSRTDLPPTASDFGIFYKLARCRNCGILFSVSEDPGAAPEQSYIDYEDKLYLSQAPERKIGCKNILRQIRGLVPANARILDVGCSYGIFLKAAGEAGMRPCGVELSRNASEYCKDILGLNVFCGDIKNASFPDNYFDAVTAIETIEHVEDPGSLMAQIYRILKPGGILCIVTPNIESLSAKILRYKWWSYRRMHIYYFSKRTLCELLKKSGFSVLRGMVYRKTFKLDYILCKFREFTRNRPLCDILDRAAAALHIRDLSITAGFGDMAVIAKKQ